MPHLFYISVGQRKRTLIFHVKIEKKCYELSLRAISNKACMLFCVNTGCKARSKITVRSEFIFQKVEKRKKTEHCLPRRIWYIDRDDKRLWDLSNY